ncbi:MAG: FAD-dependent oxidoreductase [Neomegalonema sp.]|nr:FAD-dependent oxidoreductase [Neomegalonema sp.]
MPIAHRRSARLSANQPTTPRRVGGFGRIDRSIEIGFLWNGQRYFGYEGDTLASALLANGVQMVGGSPIFSRPRGIDALGPSASGARLLLRRRGAHSATLKPQLVDPALVELTPGLEASLSPPRLLPRRSAGQAAESLSTPTPSECAYRVCDALVVGSGPAGLEAARTLAEAGRDTLLIERDSVLGGQLISDPSLIEETQPVDWLAARLAHLGRAGARMMTRTRFLGLFDDGSAGLRETRLTPQGAIEVIWQIRFNELVLAPGAIELSALFMDNDRPGVMTASALRTSLFRFGVLPGQRIVIATTNESGYLGVDQLPVAGADITILDMRLAAHARRAAGVPGVAHRVGLAPYRAVGRNGLTEVRLARREGEGWHETEQRIEADALVVAGGWRPDLTTAQACGVNASRADNGALTLASAAAEHIQLAGAATGQNHPNACAASGRNAAARLLGRPEEAVELDAETDPQAWRIGARGRMFSDLATDTLYDPEQPRLAPVDAVKPSPSLPQTLLTGLTDHPAERRAPAHSAVHALGVSFHQDAGWLTPERGHAPGREPAESHRREARAARETVGIADLSSFCKVNVAGPDAAEFLDRSCVRAASALAVGTARPTLLLEDDGVVMAETVLWRLEEDAFQLTAPPSTGAQLRRRLEALHQARWPSLKITLSDDSDAVAAFAIVGPLARRAIARVVMGVELNDQALPVGGVRACRVGDALCRLARLSRSGELGFEIYAPAPCGEALFDALWDAVRSMDGAFLGAAALETLRIERGRLGAPELNGETSLGNLGPDYAPAADRAFAGGALGRQGDALPLDRKLLVGVLPDDPTATLTPGAILRRAAGRGGQLGWISSVAWSDARQTTVALGFIEGGEPAWGGRVIVAEPDEKSSIAVRIARPDAFDPIGARARPETDPRPPELGETPRPAPLTLPARAALGGLRDDPTARLSADGDEVRLHEIAPHALLRLVAWPDRFADAEAWLCEQFALEAAPAPCRSALARNGANGNSARIFRIGPAEWRIDVSDRERFDRLAPSAAAFGDLSDISDGLARFELSGSRAAEILARRLRIDLREASFPVGAASMAPFGAMPTQLARLEANSYTIWPARSAAHWAWARLTSALS